MTETPDIRFTGVLSGSDFERLLANAVAEQVAIMARQPSGPMAELLREVHDHREKSFTEWQAAKLEIERIRDAFKAKEDQAQALIANGNTYIESKIDALKEKMNKQANTILLPAASIVLLAGLIGLWVLVGSNVFELRKQVDDSIGKVADFNSKIKQAQQDLASAQTDFNVHKQQIDEAISGTLAVDLGNKLTLVQTDLSGIHKAVSALQDAQIAAAAKSTPNPPKGGKPTPPSTNQ